MEKVVSVIQRYCTFPNIELVKFFKLTLFNFLIGNEDMHLKNFSLITRGNIVCLSPAYDLLNSTIAIGHAKEEFALPLNGKKNHLTKNDFVKYLAMERLGLNEQIIHSIIAEITTIIPQWKQFIQRSFLSSLMQTQYLQLLDERFERIK